MFAVVDPTHNWHLNCQALLDLEFDLKLQSGGLPAQRYVQQAPSGDLHHMATDVTLRAHNDKPFFAAALRIGVLAEKGDGRVLLRSLAPVASLIQHGGRPLDAVTADEHRARLPAEASHRPAGPDAAPALSPRPRTRITAGETFKFRMGCGTLFVTVNHDEHGLCEVFANLGKAGGCPSQSEATCRAVSVALRSGVEPRELIEQLRGIRCLSTARARKNGDDVNVLSCPDAIARAIEEGIGVQAAGPAINHNTCPDCGEPLRKQEGCLVCTCGFSRCG